MNDIWLSAQVVPHVPPWSKRGPLAHRRVAPTCCISSSEFHVGRRRHFAEKVIPRTAVQRNTGRRFDQTLLKAFLRVPRPALQRADSPGMSFSRPPFQRWPTVLKWVAVSPRVRIPSNYRAHPLVPSAGTRVRMVPVLFRALWRQKRFAFLASSHADMTHELLLSACSWRGATPFVNFVSWCSPPMNKKA